MKKFEELTFSDHYMFEKVLQNKTECILQKGKRRPKGYGRDLS